MKIGGQDARAPILAFIVLLLIFNAAIAQTLFQDNFNAGKSPKWKQRNDGTQPGQFRVENGMYILRSDDPVESIPRTLISGVAQTNYFLQADVQVHSLNPNYAVASLISYYTDSN